jgi:hypothetical protein
VDRHEDVGGELGRDLDALPERERAIGGARQRDLDAVLAQARRDEVCEREGQVLLSQPVPDPLGAEVGASVAGVKNHARASSRGRRQRAEQSQARTDLHRKIFARPRAWAQFSRITATVRRAP